MANRYLQLKRNAEIFSSKQSAIETLTSEAFLEDKLDGEVVAARYKINPNDDSVGEDNVAVMTGHIVFKDGSKFIKFIGSDDGLRTYIGYNDNDTFSGNVGNNIAFISASTNVTSGMVDLANAIEEVKTDIIGVGTNATAITNYISGNTYISGKTNIVEVIKDIDDEFKNIYSAITEASPESTGKTIVVTEAKDRTDGGSKANIEVNYDKKTIKQASSTGNTYEHTATTIGANELYATDAVIENGFTVRGVTVGNYKPNDVIESGTTLVEILKKMLIKEADCTPVPPSITLSISSSTTPVEVGTSFSGVLTTTYSDGRFTGASESYGTTYSVAAGCEEGNVTYSFLNAAPATSAKTTLTTTGGNSYTDNGRIIAESANTWYSKAAYGASTVTPKKNTGEDSTQTIASGETIEKSVTIVGQYKYFIGYNESLDPTTLTSNNIRSLNALTGWLTINGTTTVAGPKTSNGKSIVVACPSKYKLSSIQNGLGMDILSNFTQTCTTTVTIGGGTGSETTPYKVYMYPISNGATVEFKNIKFTKA